MVEVNGEWDYQIPNQLDSKFQFNVSSIFSEELKKLGEFKVQSCNYSNDGKGHEEELKSLAEKNKSLHHVIATKLEGLAQQKSRYQSFKSDQKLLSEEIKDRHEALLMAKKYYKKNLKIYYTIESRDKDTETILVQFFTEAKKESDHFSVRLLRNTKSNSEGYELLETNPKLPAHNELKRMFQDNDMPGALCLIRRAFLKIRKHKNVEKP